MSVLGWSRGNPVAPAGVYQRRDGPWTVLIADPSAAQTACDRLALQVRCFDSSLDFIPVAPAQNLAVSDATDISQTGHLDRLWRMLTGRGQFSIALAVQVSQPLCPQDGRGWLRARQVQQEQRLARDAMLQDITTRLNLPITPHRHGPRGTYCDVLTGHAKAHDVRAMITRMAHKINAPANVSLTVTGLWPPLGFASHAPAAEVTK
ncbi:hypothetical protein [Roseobacter sp. CCS2]|uniref:hypothetical protein n=1 Tax=Roseobacter sp. CCS2 TaxID=391593 RepID=UPI0000F3C447|nr:hypothetical protein [Roseobacter sp. CCS2]EBA11529.1 hypothetical protein RCCS2_16411 [Roseobacter sp. CCS2]